MFGRHFAALGTALLLAATAAGSAQAQANLTGAGATFPYPIYSKWFYEYAQNTGVKINYQAIGSGGGPWTSGPRTPPCPTRRWPRCR
jgi:ABC-type phosphate transport system substrate-binding protein